MPTKKNIIPERKKCDCGKKVKNHHWLCDSCWGDIAREKDRAEKRDIILGNKKITIQVVLTIRKKEKYLTLLKIIRNYLRNSGRIILNKAGNRLLDAQENKETETKGK